MPLLAERARAAIRITPAVVLVVAISTNVSSIAVSRAFVRVLSVVAAADRSEDVRAEVGPPFALAFFATRAGVLLAEFALSAVIVRTAIYWPLAGSIVIHAGSVLRCFASTRIVLAIATADLSPVRATLALTRAGNALSSASEKVAGSFGEEAVVPPRAIAVVIAAVLVLSAVSRVFNVHAR